MGKGPKKKQKWTDVIRLALLVICGAVIGINVYSINAKNLLGDQLPMPLGFGAAIVLSGSMEPTFSEGDLIIATRSDTVAADDIVVYQERDHLVVHRVMEVDGDQLITKGDANNAPDEPINMSAVKGTVQFWIPGAGEIVSAIKTPMGTICLVAAAIALVEIPRRKEKRKDDDERQKIIDEILRLKDEQQNNEK